MSKSTRIAALGLAAGAALLPVAGVFADDRTQNIETITVALPITCTFNADGTSTGSAIADVDYASVNVTNGSLTNTENHSAWSTTYNVYCNNSQGWAVYAVGSSATTKGNAATAMAPTTNAGSNAIATGTATSGADANWAFKVAAPVVGSPNTNKAAVATGYDTYIAVPASYTKVVSSDPAAEGDPNAQTIAAGEGRFTTGYQVYIGTATKADTYTGKVTYKLVNPASAAAPGSGA